MPEESRWEKFRRAVRLADFSVMTNCLVTEIEPSEARSLEYPPWVRKCGRHVTRALFPRVYRSFEGKSPSQAYGLGLAAGMFESGQKMLIDFSEEIGPIPDNEIVATDPARFWRLFDEELAKDFTFSDDGDIVPLEIRRGIAEMQLTFSLAQQADFHQGMADVARMMNGENAATSTTDIYTFMLVFWRAIDRLSTFEVFYEIVLKGFGHNRVGADPKRLAQMCQRVGKRFRRPGRPLKTTSTERKR